MELALISQTWFRMVNLIEPPVCYLRYINQILTGSNNSNTTDNVTNKSPATVSQMSEDAVSQISSSSDSLQPHVHPAYLTHWQYSFYRLMRGIHCIISALLGMNMKK